MKFTAPTIPDLSGKVILVIGGTAGIGKESVFAFAKHNPKCLYFTGRNTSQGAQIVAEIKSTVPVVFLECDFTSLASVEKAAKLVISQSDRLDILMCNAGVMNVLPALTEDGYEVHFGINHIAHALLIKLLLPTLLRTAEAPDSDIRVVSLTSQGFAMHPGGGILFDDLRTSQGSGLIKSLRYGQSKLANILYASELARRYPQITSVSIHPGVVRTDLLHTQSIVVRCLAFLTHPFSMMTPAEGAYNQLWGATADKTKIVNGEYYEPVGVPGSHMRKSRDLKLAKQLWEWTEKELDEHRV
ncbi:Short-chain dehydrogenase reductase family [Mycena venus]|uniref:Short-chain dehydrogenase reductase family n=1 Tax=Mycena venus TaxID=2733690 RepID=A0A8H7D2N6_9AGAR|nr:Short-chain dehydrogenase reductase family [Mycena venus]